MSTKNSCCVKSITLNCECNDGSNTVSTITGDPNVLIQAPAGTITSTCSGNHSVISTGGNMTVSSSGNNTIASTAGNLSLQALTGTSAITCAGNNAINSFTGAIQLTAAANTTTSAIYLNAPSGGVSINSAKEVYVTTADKLLVEATTDVYLEASNATNTAMSIIAPHGGVQIQSTDFETKIQSTDADITLQAIYNTGGGDISIESGNDSANTITLYAPLGKVLLQPGQATVCSTNLQFDTVGYGIAGKFASATVSANACTCNAYFGVITDSGTVSPGNRTDITVTNSICTANSLILIQYDATTSIPNNAPLNVSAQSYPGGFYLRVNNNSAASTDAAPIYRFTVINAT